MGAYTFDPIKKRDALIENLRTYAASSGFQDVILGISGGKDSTVAAALCARALGKEHVHGVLLPDGVQPDLSDSLEVVSALGIQHRIVNIGAIHRALLATVLRNEDPATSEFVFESDIKDVPESFSSTEFETVFHQESNFNVGPRLRMTVLRYIGQSMGARLVGTGNLSEATVGYCTKDGDTSCDFSMLGSLTSVEVVQIGLTMEEIPKHLVEKTPTDGLSGKPDEERLGVTYQEIHDFIRLGSSGSEKADDLISRKQAMNRHKREPAVVIRG